MAVSELCVRCNSRLEVLSNPIRRLRWTKYWWKGFASLFSGQLRICPRCGAMYSGDGELLAAGAVETDAERRLNTYRKDMAYVRDGFAAVVVAAEVAMIWLIGGAETFELAKVVLSGGVGVLALGPFVYFARKTHLARRDLKQLKRARIGGAIPARSETPHEKAEA